MSDIGGLAPKLRRIAASGHLRAVELNDLADKLDAARDKFYAGSSDGSIAKVVGSWARARRVYCEITGEPPV